jgi:hypothetical protein
MGTYIERIVLVTTLAFAGFVSAQEADTTVGWQHQLASTLSFTQTSFDNWQTGGKNSMAWQILLNGRSTFLNQKWR